MSNAQGTDSWEDVLERIEDYWESFYSASASRRVPERPSPFATEMLPTISHGSTVIEIGAGTGRDSLFFASQGLSVVAIDASRAAVDGIRVTAIARGLEVEALRLDATQLASAKDLHQTVAERRTMPDESARRVTVYSRFFLHAVPREVQASMLRWAGSVLNEGERAILEYRTDSLESYSFGRHYRRTVDPASVHEDASAAGFSGSHTDLSADFAPFGDERPLVARTTLTR